MAQTGALTIGAARRQVNRADANALGADRQADDRLGRVLLCECYHPRIRRHVRDDLDLARAEDLISDAAKEIGRELGDGYGCPKRQGRDSLTQDDDG